MSSRIDQLGRRRFLRGVGACITLPSLRSMAVGAEKTSQAPPPRAPLYVPPTSMLQTESLLTNGDLKDLGKISNSMNP